MVITCIAHQRQCQVPLAKCLVTQPWLRLQNTFDAEGVASHGSKPLSHATHESIPAFQPAHKRRSWAAGSPSTTAAVSNQGLPLRADTLSANPFAALAGGQLDSVANTTDALAGESAAAELQSSRPPLPPPGIALSSPGIALPPRGTAPPLQATPFSPTHDGVDMSQKTSGIALPPSLRMPSRSRTLYDPTSSVNLPPPPALPNPQTVPPASDAAAHGSFSQVLNPPADIIVGLNQVGDTTLVPVHCWTCVLLNLCISNVIGAAADLKLLNSAVLLP